MQAPSAAYASPCPLCGGAGHIRFVKRGIPICDCRACAHRYAGYRPGDDHVATVYGDAYFNGAAGEYADYDGEAAELRRRGAWYGATMARFAERGRLLDVGAASGHILQGFLDDGWSASGIEPNAEMAARARARGLNVETVTLEQFRADETFDAVALVQILPHFIDVRAALGRAASLMREGGVLLIETWDRSSVVARVLGKRWHEYNPPSVLHWFTSRTLPATMGALGFTVLASGRPLKPISGAHAKSVLSNGSGAVSALARFIPDGLSVPYPGDDVFWMMFRRNRRS